MDATRVLHAYEPADRQQEALRLEYLAFLGDHPDGVWKAGPPEHLTASRLVLDERLDRVLLTHHRARGCGSSSAGTEPADRSVRAARRARGGGGGIDALLG